MAMHSRRGQKKCSGEFRNFGTAFDSISQDTQGDRFNLSRSLFARSAIAQCAGKRRNFCDPTAIGFPIKLNGKLAHAYL